MVLTSESRRMTRAGTGGVVPETRRGPPQSRAWLTKCRLDEGRKIGKEGAVQHARLRQPFPPYGVRLCHRRRGVERFR